MDNEANQSKGRGNPGGSQSGGTKEKESTDQLKEQGKKDKQKRQDDKGNFSDDKPRVRKD